MKAYYETVHNGLIPVEIVGIVTSDGRETIVCKITRSQYREHYGHRIYSYRAGELIETSARHLVSRRTRTRSGHIYVSEIPVADIRAAIGSGAYAATR